MALESAALVAGLEKILGEGRVLASPEDLFLYSYDSSFESEVHQYLPQAVVLPQDREEVVEIVKFASRNSIPLTPRGAGTGQCGGSVPACGGIVVDMCRMDRIVEVDADNLQAIVEPGVVHAALNAALAPHGLVFPPDPGSSKVCTLGGMVSYNARGMRGVKYGCTGDYVLGMEVVLASGEVITTGSVGSRSLHSASGFDLTHLFVGAEGILGIITLLRLRLLPLPEARGIVLAAFDKLERAGQAVMAVFRAGLLPSAVEILDRMAIKGVNLYRPQLELPEVEALLFFEVDGNPAAVSHQAEKVAQVVARYAEKVDWADDTARVRELWEGRAVAGVASGLVRPDGTRIYAGEDICVPLTKVTEALHGIQEIGAKHDTIIVTYGHIGDGNLHAAPIIKTDDSEEVRRAKLVEEEIHRLALKLGGTVTGEHGVGITRKPYMRAEHGRALDVMWQIKRVLDPHNIMNPGKMFPDEMVAGFG